MANVTPGYTFTGTTDPITSTKLNLLGQPTVTIGSNEITSSMLASGNTYATPTLSGGTTITQATPLYETASTVSWATAISLTFTTADGNMREILINNSTSLNSTITPASIPRKGYILRLSFLADATGGNTITFGTGFKSTGTLASLTANKYYQVTFLSNGTNLLEVSRTAAVG